jgi:release factor glutamine methyltransferase
MKDNRRSLTLRRLCQQGGRELKENGVSNHVMEAELLLADLLNISREHLLSHFDQEVEDGVHQKYREMVSRRKNGTPLAYLMGYKEFYNLKFIVDKRVLIPRPETELLVEEVLKYVHPKSDLNDIAMIDIGVGSGCIPISLLKNMDKDVGKVFCSDVSQKALKIAYLNAVNHRVEKCIKFLYGSFALPLFYEFKDIKKYSELIITANLPYLSNKKYQASPSIQKEPQLALLGGGPAGLKAYKILLHQLYRLTSKMNSRILVFCELDDDQVAPFEKIVADIFLFYKMVFKKDIKGNYRVAILELNI